MLACSITRAAVLVSVALAAGCALPKATSEADKDVSGTYDGQWRVNVLPAANRTQEKPGWRLNCEGMEQEFVLEVREGVISGLTGEDTRHEAFVGADGRFTLAMPIAAKSSEAAGSTVILGLSDTTLFVSGDLSAKQPSGTFMIGVKEFGNSGCRTKAGFERV